MTLAVTSSASPMSVVKVRPATLADAEALPTIDRDAGQVFRQFSELAWLADGEGMPVERHRAFIAKGAAWVGVNKNNAPVGFLDAEVIGGELHVWEMSVHRDWQGRGLGRALMAAASAYATRAGLAALTLTTFRDVPWNGPFYERLGFAAIPPSGLSARLRQVLADEVAGGLPKDRRCAMRRIL